MGLRQDKTFSDARKLAFVAGVLSPPMAYVIPVPIIYFAPPLFYDLMSPMTMKPFTTFTPFTSIPGSTKTLRPSYPPVPFYPIAPFQFLQPQLPPPQWIPPPQTLSSAFWDVVKRTAEHSMYGAAGFAWLLSEIAKRTPEKEQTCVRDDRELSSCDSLDLGFLSSTPTEDDLLRVDMSELESLSSSELYFDKSESAASAAAVPSQPSTPVRSPPYLRSRSSDAPLAAVLHCPLSVDDLTALLRIPDDELYFNLEDLSKLGAAPPWPFRSSAFAPSTSYPVEIWRRYQLR